MAQIQSPETFVNGQQVTDVRLNNHVNGSQLLPGAITDQSALTANTLATGDEFLINDASASALRRVTADTILNSGLNATLGTLTANSPIEIKSLSGNATTIQGIESTVGNGVSVKVFGKPGTANNNQVVLANSALSVADITKPDVVVDGTMVVSGLSKFNSKADFATTGAVKIPVGTTAQRPGTPAQGDLRYNTTTSNTEVYNGTAWEEVGGGPFDATGGNTIIAPDTTVNSGVSFTSADGYRVTVTHSGHSVTPGQTIEFTTAVSGYSGEFTVYEADATTFKFFMVTVATPNSGTGSYRKAGNFKCHIFTSGGTFVAGSKDGYVEVLVVGGGGGGESGNFFSGGGGGGVAYVPRYKVLSGQTVTVSIGSGGAIASNGGSSIFGSVTAYGGSAGAGNTGGSSGATSINPTTYSGTSGGGGAGSQANGQIVPGLDNDIGGVGTSSGITGVTKNFAYGGNEAHNSIIGYPSDLAFENGPANSGRGGNSNKTGGSGIVIVRYPYWL